MGASVEWSVGSADPTYLDRRPKYLDPHACDVAAEAEWRQSVTAYLLTFRLAPFLTLDGGVGAGYGAQQDCPKL
jgi:hypothetical protein